MEKNNDMFEDDYLCPDWPEINYETDFCDTDYDTLELIYNKLMDVALFIKRKMIEKQGPVVNPFEVTDEY